MQLNVTTDYAIRTVLYLGQCKKIASATEISNEMGIPRGYLEKVLSKLKKAEYISADLGARGGYRLNKTLKDITLGDVIRLMESTTKINRCLEDDAYCSRKAVDFCAVRRYYAKVQEKLETQFFSISLKEILEYDSQLFRLDSGTAFNEINIFQSAFSVSGK